MPPADVELAATMRCPPKRRVSIIRTVIVPPIDVEPAVAMIFLPYSRVSPTNAKPAAIIKSPPKRRLLISNGKESPLVSTGNAP